MNEVSIRTTDDVKSHLSPLFRAWYNVETESDIAVVKEVRPFQEVETECDQTDEKIEGVVRAYWKGDSKPFFTLHYIANEQTERDLSLNLGYYPWMEIDLKKHFLPVDPFKERLHAVAILVAALGLEFFLICTILT